ncbi:hypothetical protein HVA01_32650 [Halovibrio variabilis]|uniref:Beta protein n=1 Tax=Halovibrio variabilis TaxID=31910 RepID=A0A511USQ2_9GAMM|nr:beta family protein [Halovibrio variabilis]GEN29619.1 hypothetical protein HVA01_32650 [Halovibrio variabilis]
MKITSDKYVPALKWRQGEYQALLNLKTKVKDKVVPLLTIPPREYDFEERKMKKTVHEHVETFPKRLYTKWSNRLALIDLHDSLEDELMDDGRSVIEFVLNDAVGLGCNVRPVVSISKSSSYISSIRSFLTSHETGVVLRLKLNELLKPTVNSDIATLMNSLGVNSWEEVDLVVDLEEPENFEPYNLFATIISGAINKINGCSACRSLIFVATSLKLREVKKPGAIQKRHEWGLFLSLRNELTKTIYPPCYGDYTIESPAFLSLDMRKMKPAGKIVYTIDEEWFVPKGGAFRGNEAQMIDHCKAIISSGKYSTSGFSEGDKRIDETANKLNNCGNLTTWKWVGVNHHITFVVRQLSNLHDS